MTKPYEELEYHEAQLRSAAYLRSEERARAEKLSQETGLPVALVLKSRGKR